jgi:AcrR family transcriptional regulator
MPRTTPPGRRDAILQSARQEFAVRGFAAARMEDIARGAGISKAALYLMFDSKEALFRALVEALVADMLPQIIPSEFGDMSAVAILSAMVPAAMARLTSGDVAFVPRLIIGEGGRFPELTRFYHDAAISRVLGLLEALIAHGVARGEFRPVDAHHVARSIAGGVVFALFWKALFEPVGAEPLDGTAMAAAHVDLLLRGLETKA